MCRIQWSPTKKKRELEKSALSFQTDRSNIYEIKKWQEKEYNQRKSVEIHEKNNQWKKSVWIREICGTKIINEKKSASSAKSAWQTNIQREEKKQRRRKRSAGRKNKTASEIFRNLRLFTERRRRPTLPHCIAVPSAQVGLTSLFGMGRGGTPPQ